MEISQIENRSSADVTGTPLSREAVEAYHSDGFLIVEDFIDEKTLEELRTAYDEIVSGEIKSAGDRMLGGVTRQVMMPSANHANFNENSAVARGLDICRQLFDTDEVFRTFDMLIYKPPGHPHDTPWHQDAAYLGRPVAEAGIEIPLESIQFWVALDDADAENGCMHFVPGYQTRPLLEHQVISGDPGDEGRLLGLVDTSEIDQSEVVVAEISAGSCTIHSYGTPHYTTPNKSDHRPRRAYIFNIATMAGIKRMVG